MANGNVSITYEQDIQYKAKAQSQKNLKHRWYVSKNSRQNKQTKRFGGVCALCRQSCQRFAKSHIQPTWLVRDRAPKGDFFLISPDDPFRRQLRTGIYDFFLCTKCESNSKQYDDYSALFFRTSDLWKSEKPHGFSIKVVENYDYTRLKLFFMHLLFRAVVTTQEFFKSVTLEPSILSRLEDLIKTNDPGGYDEFSVIINMRMQFAGFEKIGESPKPNTDNEGNRWYRFDLNEFPCDVKASSSPSTNLADFVLKPKPPLLIYEGPIAKGRFDRIKMAAEDREQREKDFKESHQ